MRKEAPQVYARCHALERAPTHVPTPVPVPVPVDTYTCTCSTHRRSLYIRCSGYRSTDPYTRYRY